MLQQFKARSCGAMCVCVVGLLTSSAWAQFGPTKVTTAEVIQRSDVSAGRAFVGTLEARRHSAIGSAVSGRVVEFLVNEGDAVEKGQPLAKLLTRNLEIQIRAARAEHELRKQELLELKNGSREEERRAAENRMKAAEASMKFARTRLARTRELIGRNAATQNQLDDDVSAADVAVNNYLAAQAAFDLVKAGPRPETIAQAEARTLSAEEEINRLLDLLEKHTIVSPFAGYVVAEHTEVGQWIESGKLVAEVVEVNPLEIRVPVPETYISALKKNVEARVEIDAIHGESFVGRVTSIVPKADEKSRNFPVKITLSNPAKEDGTHRLSPGMFARVWLPVDLSAKALFVPKDSLVLGGPQPVVFVVDAPAKGSEDKPKVRPIPVQLGISSEAWIEVRGDLKAGQTVVVEGNERLRPGAEVVPVSAELRRPGEKQPEKSS